MAKKPSKKTKHPRPEGSTSKKMIRRKAERSFQKFGHAISAWTHSPSGHAREALARCTRCGQQLRVNLATGDAVMAHLRCVVVSAS